MAFPQGIDFRATSGYVGDPTDCDYEIGTTANYPRTSAQGNSVGWEDAPTGTVDRVAYSGDARKCAGIAYNGGSEKRYRIDLPATGDYKFRCAGGDAGGGNEADLKIKDTTTTVLTPISNHLGMSTNTFYDATNTLRSSESDWVTNNALSAAVTFSTTICRFHLGPASVSVTCLAHVWVEAVGGGGGGGSVGHRIIGGGWGGRIIGA